jgi:Bifunctional DNA primase/polymerase, N-terminal/Primase C terminal 1 (PriCT-1)
VAAVGCQRRASDHDEINRLWKFYAADSVGIACRSNGFVAVDIDPRDGGSETMAALTAEHGQLPRTPFQRTGSGGSHILLRHPDFDPVGSLGPGVQIKSAGYIIGAPSLHEKTKRPYEWGIHPFEVKIAKAPDWLLECLVKPQGAGGKTDWGSVETLDVRTGDRTNTLTRIAGHLFRKRVDPQVAFPLLWSWNCTSCTPLPLAKVEATILGIWNREQRRRCGS